VERTLRVQGLRQRRSGDQRKLLASQVIQLWPTAQTIEDPTGNDADRSHGLFRAG
jgi:hypothetical protein